MNQIDSSAIAKRKALMLREHSLIEPIIKNPFVHTLELGKLDKLKVRFMNFYLYFFNFV